MLCFDLPNKARESSRTGGTRGQGVSMRVMRVTLAAILGCMMAMAWVGAPAFADGGHGGGGGGGGGGHDAGRDDGGGGGGVQDIQVRDDCDPATFNAAI